jgi:DNA-binding CsgD family transcriptional regulator
MSGSLALSNVDVVVQTRHASGRLHTSFTFGLRENLLTLRSGRVACTTASESHSIGAILGISAATVGKHRDSQSRYPASLGSPLRWESPAVKLAPSQLLERIYPKLGVENRTVAASFAAEVEQ